MAVGPERGVDARQQVTVQSVAGPGPFRIATSDGEFESRALVNASGRWSNLNLLRAEATGSAGRNGWGSRPTFAEPPSEPSVDLYFFEGGYCGVQPVAVAGDPSSGRVNASAMVRADVASALPEVFARHPALRERSRNWSPLSDPVSTSPLIFRPPQPERDGMLMVGDAAGFVDPFVGDGISLASAKRSAGSTLPAGLFSPAKLPCPKRRAAMVEPTGQSLLPVFRASSTIRRMLVLPGSIRKPLLSILESTPAITNYLVRKTR